MEVCWVSMRCARRPERKLQVRNISRDVATELHAGIVGRAGGVLRSFGQVFQCLCM